MDSDAINARTRQLAVRSRNRQRRANRVTIVLLMGRALALAIIACIASCYRSPSLASCKYRCGGANNDSCPSGYECNAGMCVAPGEGCDGDGGVIDAPPDDALTDGTIDMIDAQVCANPNAPFWNRQPTTLATGNNLMQMVAFDGNHDGLMDIAVLDSSTTVGFFAGNGNGTFDARQESSAGANAKRLIAGDFDHDGSRNDLMVLQTGPTDALGVMISNEDGTFTRTNLPIGTNAVDIASAGDVDGNTFEDIGILSSGSSARIEVLKQIATSPFWAAGTMVATNMMATSLMMGRVNSGTIPDAVVTMTGANQIGMHAGASTAVYSLSTLIAETVSGGPVDVATAQMRATGMPSVVTANQTGNSISIRHASGVSTFSDGGSFVVGTSPKAVILADVGGTPLPDILTANSGANTFSVLLNQDPLVPSNWEPSTPIATDANPIDLVSADFDGDGRLDVAVACQTAGTVVIYLNRCNP